MTAPTFQRRSSRTGGSAPGLALALALCLPPLLGLLPRMAAADTPRFSVPTYVDPCVPIDRRKFQELLAVELGATPDYGKLERANGSASVSLTCVDGQVQLELDDAVTRKSMRRRVDLLRVDPEARTRLMALTTAEFVLASWLEIRLDKQHDALEPSGPAPSPLATDRAARAVAPRFPPARPAPEAPTNAAPRAEATRVRAAGERATPKSEPTRERVAREPTRERAANERAVRNSEATRARGANEHSAPNHEPTRERTTAPGEPGTRERNRESGDSEGTPRAESEPSRASDNEQESGTAAASSELAQSDEADADSASAPSQLDSLQLGAAFEMLGFSSAFQLIPAGALRLTIPLGAHFALRTGAQAGHTQLDGTLAIESSTRPVRVRLTTLSLLLAALYGTRLFGLDLAIGLGGRLGLAYLAGTDPDEPSVRPEQAWVPWAGPLATASLTYPVSQHLGVTLAVELGIVALGARAIAPNNVVTEIRGAWFGGSLGLDWAFSPSR